MEEAFDLPKRITKIIRTFVNCLTKTMDVASAFIADDVIRKYFLKRTLYLKTGVKNGTGKDERQ